MATYVILSRFSPNAFTDPKDFKKLAKTVSQKIKKECTDIIWKDSFATMGRSSMSLISLRQRTPLKLKKRQ